MDVVDFAWQVIKMQRTIDAQEREITRLQKIEQEHKELLDSSIKHGNAMMGNILEMCMMPDVVQAMRKNTSTTPG